MSATWELTPWYLRFFKRRPTFRRLEETYTCDAIMGAFPEVWSYSNEPWDPTAPITIV